MNTWILIIWVTLQGHPAVLTIQGIPEHWCTNMMTALMNEQQITRMECREND